MYSSPQFFFGVIRKREEATRKGQCSYRCNIGHKTQKESKQNEL